MNPNYMSQGGYNNQGSNMAAHRGQFMDGMYQQHSQGQQYPPQYSNQNQGQYSMGQYNQQNSAYGPMMGYNNNQQRMQNHPSTATSHLHSRHQNPQEVANNILQMAASYQPSQTVQVPLSKHRSAPYHVPVSAHYNMQNHVVNPEQMNRQFNYPISSPHNPHAARTSPVSPGSMYMHSPASQHSSQSLPNSSPRSIHSPPGGYGNIKSPVPTPSPAGGLRSPCHMQSPINTPINQQLHVTTGQQMVQSPPQQQQMGYSPKNNPISPPVIHSPHFKQQHVKPQQQHTNQKTYINENMGTAATNYTANSPLQSLQKLCMLPDRQVVDPKSIVNDPSSSSPNQNQKNVNSDVDSNSWNTTTISETASTNVCTDGKNCNENITNNSHELTRTCETDQSSHWSESQSNVVEETQCATTIVESYADDAVKKTAENIVKIDRDLECQKLKYLGQPCNTESGMNKDLKSDINVVPKENCKAKDSDTTNLEEHQNKEPYGNKNHSHTTTKTSQSCAVGSQSKDFSSNSCDRLQKRLESLENVCVEQTSDNSEPIDIGSKHSKSSRLESNGTEQKSHDISKRVNGTGDVQNDFGLKSDIVIDSESVCDKSIVDGCENLNCDEQSKTYISSDCRKDEVKSVVNGIDDSDDVCSDIDINKKDLLIRNEQNDIDHHSDSVVNNSKTGQKHKNQEKSESKRVLREIPARLASASPFYVDESDSDDDGILLVRKDVKYTYSRYNKVHPNISNSHISVSDNEIVDDISDEESLDRNSLDSDISKGFDSDLIRPVKPVITKLSESKIKSGSNLGPKKKGNTSKSLKKKEIKQENVTIDNPGHSSEVKTESQRVNSRTKRTRTTTSKYGDEMYLGDDFVLDSEEEIEIEKKSKRKRKVSGDPRSNFKIKSEESVVDSEEEIEIEKKSKRKRKVSGDPRSTFKIKSVESAKDSEEDVEIENKSKKKQKTSGDVKSNLKIKSETDDSVDILDSKEICIDIIDSSDNLGDGSDIITFKTESVVQNKPASFQPIPSTSKSQRENKPLVKKVKPQTKGKTKVSKVGKSKSRGKLLDDSIKNMKLKKTMDLMKQKGKKKPDVPVKETGPFLRVKDSGTQKEKCVVVNQQIEESSDKISKNKKSSVSVSTVHMSKLPSEKSVYWPASLMGDNSVWVCALCQKHSSYKFLGDLFGPYYVEGSLPDDGDGTNSSDKKGKQKRQSLNSSIDLKCTKSKRKSREPIKPQEVWVHEDCAAWADGVLLIGAKIYGLQEATNVASSTVSILLV